MTEQSTIIKNIRVIVTHPYGRAGSLFVHSLFDSHPNILTLPRCGDMHSLFPKSVTKSSLKADVDAFIADYPGIFDSSKDYFGNISGIVTGRFGYNGDENIEVDVSAFKEKLFEMASHEFDTNGWMSRRTFFILIHLAYAQCVRPMELSQCKYIFYHPHTNKEWDELFVDFPNLYFIAMTRDPRQDWVSWKKIHGLRLGRDGSQTPPISLLIRANDFSEDCQYLHAMRSKFHEDHLRIIDLDNFHVMNREAMLRFCEWLEIEFNESLMSSTFNGLTWYGNSIDLKKISTFNPNMKRGTWKNDLSEYEIDLINRLIPGTIRYLHYDIEDKYGIPAPDTEPKGVRYESSLRLLGHVFLHLGGNPLVIFPGKDAKYPVLERFERRLRNILRMGRIARYSLHLSRQLKGKRLNNLLNALAAHEKEFLDNPLPQRLFIENKAQTNVQQAETKSPTQFQPMSIAR